MKKYLKTYKNYAIFKFQSLRIKLEEHRDDLSHRGPAKWREGGSPYGSSGTHDDQPHRLPATLR